MSNFGLFSFAAVSCTVCANLYLLTVTYRWCNLCELTQHLVSSIDWMNCVDMGQCSILWNGCLAHSAIYYAAYAFWHHVYTWCSLLIILTSCVHMMQPTYYSDIMYMGAVTYLLFWHSSLKIMESIRHTITGQWLLTMYNNGLLMDYMRILNATNVLMWSNALQVAPQAANDESTLDLHQNLQPLVIMLLCRCWYVVGTFPAAVVKRMDWSQQMELTQEASSL